MHVYINSDGVSVGEFKVVIIILRSSYVQESITRITVAWMLINSYFQTAIEHLPWNQATLKWNES